MEHMIHEIKPVFNDKSRILILGSFPSVKSREGQFFYHHPQNRFWKVLAASLSQPVPATVERNHLPCPINHSGLGRNRILRYPWFQRQFDPKRDPQRPDHPCFPCPDPHLHLIPTGELPTNYSVNILNLSLGRSAVKSHLRVRPMRHGHHWGVWGLPERFISRKTGQ